MPTGEKKYIYVPFKEKDKAKLLGALWSPKVSCWYVPDHLSSDQKLKLSENFRDAIGEDVEIKVKYNDRDEVKNLGCRWDPERKTWFIPFNTPIGHANRILTAYV